MESILNGAEESLNHAGGLDWAGLRKAECEGNREENEDPEAEQRIHSIKLVAYGGFDWDGLGRGGQNAKDIQESQDSEVEQRIHSITPMA